MALADKPAFPVLHSIDGNWVRDPRKEYSGMTLREHAAIEAMNGLLSGLHSEREHLTEFLKTTNGKEKEALANMAIAYADALIKQLKEKDHEQKSTT